MTFAEEYVAQQYIARPLLISGRKFDLRLYVLVTSFGPLEAFIYRQGFARFSYSQYDASNVRDLGVHLTNASVQKYNPRGTEGAPPGAEPGLPESVKGPGAVEGGSKIPLTRLWELMDEMRPVSRCLHMLNQVLNHVLIRYCFSASGTKCIPSYNPFLSGILRAPRTSSGPAWWTASRWP